jgi:hypothetical protein
MQHTGNDFDFEVANKDEVVDPGGYAYGSEQRSF